MEIESPFANELFAPVWTIYFPKGTQHWWATTVHFTQCVRDAQNHKPMRHTVAVFLDLSKAFYRVWKYKHLNKCFEILALGVKHFPGYWIFWITENFCVKHQNTFSGVFEMYQGVPQGFVLSPILFSLFISRIVKRIYSCRVALFTDDIVMFNSCSDISKLEFHVNSFGQLFKNM